MRTLQRFATVCFIGAAFAALFSACSSTDTPVGPGGAGAPSAGAPSAGAPGAGAPGAGAPGAGAPGAGGGSAGGGSVPTGNAAKGMTVFSGMAACATCHGTMGEGGIGPNITGSKMFGIGNWTEVQFHDALRSGKDKSGAMFYVLMAPVDAATASDADINDLYAYLMSHSVETMNAGSACTSPGTCKGTH